MSDVIDCFSPEWPAPSSVGALISTRNLGDSQGVYARGNLALHVGDDAGSVARNRSLLCSQSQIPNWQWLSQVHGTQIIEATGQSCRDAIEADGSFTRQPGIVCAVLTADCLPVLLCNRAGNQVAAVHAGWRGLCAGILVEVVSRFDCPPDDLCIYLGPAIGATAFEVGEDVKLAFAHSLERFGVGYSDRQHAIHQSFNAIPNVKGKYWADLNQMARSHVQHCGVVDIYGGDHCTAQQTERFYSFRKEGVTGRFVSAIWIKP